MIYFGENARSPFMKVWSVEDKGKYVKGQVSTSKKNKDGTYENSSWFCSFVGAECAEKAKDLEKGDTIVVTSGTVSMVKDKNDTKKSYVNMAIFAFDLKDFENKPAKSKSFEEDLEDDDSESGLPF